MREIVNLTRQIHALFREAYDLIKQIVLKVMRQLCYLLILIIIRCVNDLMAHEAVDLRRLIYNLMELVPYLMRQVHGLIRKFFNLVRQDIYFMRKIHSLIR